MEPKKKSSGAVWSAFLALTVIVGFIANSLGIIDIIRNWINEWQNHDPTPSTSETYPTETDTLTPELETTSGEIDTIPTEPEIQWQYSKKIYTTSQDANLDGWEVYKTKTTDNYSTQSQWQYTPIQETDSIKVITATHYKWYRYETETIEGEWSDWTTERRTNLPDNVVEQSKEFTQYGYYYFRCANCGYRMHGWSTNCFNCGVFIENDHGWISEYFDTPWNDANLQDWYGTGHYYTMELDGTRWFQWTVGDSTRQITKYAYSEISTKEVITSDILYSETYIKSVPGIYSEPVTAYAYCTKTPITTYYYYKWSEWEDCEEGEYQNDDNTKVRTITK